MVEASTESIQVQSVGQWLTNHLTPDAEAHSRSALQRVFVAAPPSYAP